MLASYLFWLINPRRFDESRGCDLDGPTGLNQAHKLNIVYGVKVL